MFDRARRATAVLLLAACWPLSAAAQQAAGERVGELNSTLLEVMRDAEALGFEGRYERLAPVLERLFAFPAMARVAAGGHWRGLSAEDRGRLVDSFARFSIATFASRFDGYSGERFEVSGERPAARGAVLVENAIIQSSGERVGIDYLLRPVDGEWRIFDIYLDSRYSELATRRSEYVSILDGEGFEGLMRTLEDKIAELSRGSGA